MYAIKYSKDYCPKVEDACGEIVWDYFADYVPEYLSECIDYHKFVADKLGEIEIVEAEDYFIFLSNEDFHKKDEVVISNK